MQTPRVTESEDDMDKTEEMIKRFEELDRRLRQSSEERHRVNNSINSSITSLVDKTEHQDTVLSGIQQSVHAVAESVQRVENCLVGDPKFNRLGLIKDVSDVSAKNAALEVRMQTAEDNIRTTSDELKTQKRIAVWSISLIAGIAAIITFIKEAGVLDFLNK